MADEPSSGRVGAYGWLHLLHPADHRLQTLSSHFVLVFGTQRGGEHVGEQAETHVEAWPPAFQRWCSGATSLQLLHLLPASTLSMSSFSLLINTPILGNEH